MINFEFLGPEQQDPMSSLEVSFQGSQYFGSGCFAQFGALDARQLEEWRISTLQAINLVSCLL